MAAERQDAVVLAVCRRVLFSCSQSSCLLTYFFAMLGHTAQAPPQEGLSVGGGGVPRWERMVSWLQVASSVACLSCVRDRKETDKDTQ
ncbi:hypothetical protein CesoFtcFv8_003345 [Champsocephalus esox]|uniref:Uncharacterized protein n=1 Tax=Champsocephalus esox TaxID=159716 RepID=A0AAN8HBE2_9TELE|nr:hypothetical protein CesoFtcFv8_003345 [Champsocephalus esox]